MPQTETSLASDLPTQTPQTFRLAMLLLTTIVGIYCIWLLVAELRRPGVIRLPNDPQAAATAAQKRGDAGWAARIGVIRGDLWAESGYTFADLLWTYSGDGSDQVQSLELARNRLGKAIRYAPTQAGVWLLLSGLASHFPQAAEALRMSYFTGPSELSLMQTRTFIAAQMPTLDTDMQQLARRDVRLLLTHQQKPAIVQAYRVASSSGKLFIEQELGETDPSLVQKLRRGAQ